MNVLLWVLQVGLALFNLAGGSYKVFQYSEMAKVPATAALSRGGWGAVGVLEMVCGVLLIVPALVKRVPVLTPAAAAVLTIECVALAILYGRYSTSMTATNPLPYVLVGGLVAAFIAYGRFALRPIA